MFWKSLCCLLLGLMAFLVSCEEPRRKTEKQKREEAHEKERARNISKGPFEDYRYYTSYDRMEKLKGRLVKKYRDGIVIERESDGKFFSILLTNLNRRDLLFIKTVVEVDEPTPMPRFISNRNSSIERLKLKEAELLAKIENPRTGTALRRGLFKEQLRIKEEITELELAIKQQLKGRNFIETPR